MLFVLCMSIASFIFITVKKKLKIFENVEHVHAPKSLGACGRSELGSLGRRIFGVGSPRLLLGVPTWGSLLLADGTPPPPQRKFVILLWQSFIN